MDQKIIIEEKNSGKNIFQDININQEEELEKSFKYHFWIRIFITIFLSSSTCVMFIGYNGLKPILINLKMFHSQFCDNDELTCQKQIRKLNEMFQLTLGIKNVIAFLLGLLIDICMMKLKVHIMYYIFTIGNFLSLIVFGCCVYYREMDKYYWIADMMYISFGICGMGLWLLFMRVFMKVPEKFEFYSSVVNGLLNSSVALSILMFYIFNVLYFFFKFNILATFLVYSIVFLILFLVNGCFLEIPKRLRLFFKEKEEKSTREKKKVGEKIELKNEWKKKKYLLLRYIFSWRYLIIVLWFCSTLQQLNFYVSTMYDQVIWITNSEDKAKTYSDLYSFIFPFMSSMGGIIFGFYVRSLGFSVILLSVLNLLWSVLSLTKFEGLIVITFTIESLSDSLTFVVLFEMIKLFFSMDYLGTLVGICISMGGIVTFLTIPLNLLVYKLSQGNFFPYNLLLSILTILSNIFLIIMIFWKPIRKLFLKNNSNTSYNNSLN